MIPRGTGGFIFMGGLAPRDRKAILMGLAVIVPVLGWIGVVRPYLAALEDVKDRIELERELLARELALLDRGPLLPEALREAELRAGQYEGRMLRASNGVLAEGELTRFLEEAAQESRVLLEQIRSGELGRGEEAPPGLSLVRLHLSGESDLEGIMAFLAAMERSHLLLRVRGLALEPETARGGTNGQEGARGAVPTGVVKVQVIVDGFARLEEEGRGGADVYPDSNPWRS
jgi:hypothetical protein